MFYFIIYLFKKNTYHKNDQHHFIDGYSSPKNKISSKSVH